MIYIKVHWKHNFQNEPIFLYMELDENRNEIRKVEIFGNDLLGYAYKNININGTFLSKFKIPELCEINEDSQFDAFEIDKETFELIWNRAVKKS